MSGSGCARLSVRINIAFGTAVTRSDHIAQCRITLREDLPNPMVEPVIFMVSRPRQPVALPDDAPRRSRQNHTHFSLADLSAYPRLQRATILRWQLSGSGNVACCATLHATKHGLYRATPFPL